MGRPRRPAGGGEIFHVLNRASSRVTLFEDNEDFAAFERVLAEGDEHVETVCRYVERNPLRADLVARAEEWRWGSLHRRLHGTAEEKAMLSEWPIARRRDWIEHVNEPLNAAELEALRLSSRRGRPFGDATWSERIVQRLSLQSTLRPRGRPRKIGRGS